MANEMGDYLPAIDFGDTFIPKFLSLGFHHNCVISYNNRIKCWGQNDKGELGYEDTENRGDGPNEMGNDLSGVDLGDDFVVRQVSLGDEFSCASSVDGSNINIK